MANDTEDFSLRPNVRPLVFAVVANLVLGAALLGWPYVRGGQRAEASAAAFARFGACLFDGRVATAPGLALPRGERARFATLVLRGEASWPGRCREALQLVVEDEARFLFPSVKAAELVVRERVRQLDRALGQLERERASGLVPERPLELLTQLQAALVEQARAADLPLDPSREAIRLGDSADLATPSIVPLQVASGGRWDVGLDGPALVASATDVRLVGHVRVVDGRVEQRATRRPRLATGLLGGREPPWVAWTTADDQCGEGGCAQRATGLAALTEDRQRLAPFAWLAAHPLGEADEAVRVDARGVWIAALGVDGQAALRRFDVPTRPEAQDVPLVRPALERTFAAGAVARVHWLPGDPPALVWVGSDGAGIVRGVEDAEPLALDAPSGTVRIASCGDAASGWIAISSERGTRVVRADGQGAHSVPVRLRPPDRGALRATCESEGVEVWARQDGALVRTRCTLDGCGEPEPVVARGVERFDVLRFRDAVWVAHASGTEAPVWLTRLRAGEVSTFAPAACWSPARGLCGEPRLVADDARMLLVARQGADLRVIETRDGTTWRGLEGLEQP